MLPTLRPPFIIESRSLIPVGRLLQRSSRALSSSKAVWFLLAILAQTFEMMVLASIKLISRKIAIAKGDVSKRSFAVVIPRTESRSTTNLSRPMRSSFLDPIPKLTDLFSLHKWHILRGQLTATMATNTPCDEVNDVPSICLVTQ